jgi:DNA polymerase III delta prime subunit
MARSNKPDWGFRNERWLICGPSGCGKTTLAIFLANGLIGRRALRPFCFDQKAELHARLGRHKLCQTGADVAAEASSGRPCCFHPGTMFPGATEKGFVWFTEFVWRYCRSEPDEFLFVLDEVQDFVGPNRTDVPKALGCLIESGRGYKVHSVCIAQSANLVNARLRQQFNAVAVFRQTDSTATAPLRAWGFDAEEVAALPQWTALVLHRDSGQRERAVLTKQRGTEQVRFVPSE